MIKIIDNFYIDADDRQFILVQWDGTTYYDKKTKKDYPTKQGMLYFTNFSNLLEKLAIIMQRRGIEKSGTLEEVRVEFIRTKNIIEDLSRRLTPTLEDVSDGSGEPPEALADD